jgi:hypothetical protein
MNVDTMDSLVLKVQEMKEVIRRSKKDRHLLLNMKMLVKDCTQSTLMKTASLATIGDSTPRDSNASEASLPKAKEVWRWLKLLLSSYMNFLKTVNL